MTTPSTGTVAGLDALMPPEMAAKAEQIGVAKATMGWRNTLALGFLAGAFIALGAVFANTVTAGAAGKAPFGLVRLAGGAVFCLGLILVVVAGAELFTGNNLIIMAWANRRITTRSVLRNWALVYAGNFVGAVATAVLIFLAGQHKQGGGAVGIALLQAAEAKCRLGWVEAVALGMCCNALVCLAVWLCFSARTTTDRILSILFPITAFVAAGFEHCVANMYIIPSALLVKVGSANAFWEGIGKTPGEYVALTWGNFIVHNLVPVTLGNMIGGSVMVGLVYWFVYLRKGLVPR